MRALRGREEIAQLTARLRREHEEYEGASQSWSPEAEEKKRELRKARAETLVEIGAALECLGEVERLQEIERLPFEQKLARLEAFLAVAEPPAARLELEATATLEAPRAEQEMVAGDARDLTPEEPEVRAARAAARREKLRAKATEKADRRKARAAIAKGKQKQKVRRLRNDPEPRRPSQAQVEEPVANESPTPRASSRRNDPRVLALLVAIVLVAGGVVLFLATRV